jgi:hypothetical protein
MAHALMIGSFTRHSARRWKAECACGWSMTDHVSWTSARDAADEHLQGRRQNLREWPEPAPRRRSTRQEG